MSQVQLHVRPRRVRCSTSSEPPPFAFRPAAAAPPARDGALGTLARVPARTLAVALVAIGHFIDAASFLTGITVWCALHLTVWSYAFDMGPAADCFGLPCAGWLRPKVIIACVALAVVSFVASRILRRLEHRATSLMLVVLVTFDLSGVLLLGVRSVT
ncbi:MAG: hypothetical protein JWM98_925 [Thermoleophilia bacterium]|nr:hypothetical protein [Thermoleophilia bacterium]